MKKYLALFLSLCISVFANAQATDLVVDCQTPGWLSSKINYGDQQTVKNLKVTGYINDTDLAFIGSLASNRSLNGILDLGDVVIVGESSDKDNCFDGTKLLASYPYDDIKPTLEKFICPQKAISVKNVGSGFKSIDIVICDCAITSVDKEMLSYNPTINQLVLGENITKIENNAIHYNYCRVGTMQFPSTLNSIGDYACDGLFDDLLLSNISEFPSLEYIGFRAFVTNGSNKEKLPDTMNFPKIKDYHISAFNYREGMHIFLGSELATMRYNISYAAGVSQWKPNLKNVYFHFKTSTPPNFINETNKYNGAYFMPYGLTIYVPTGSKEAYAKALTGGMKLSSQYHNIIEEDVLLEKIILNPKELSLEIGEKTSIEATLLPNNVTDKTIIWSVDDEKIVSVSQTGEVEALSPGETNVYASSADGKIIDVCKVTVKAHAESVSVSPETITFNHLGETKQLTANVLPDNAVDKSVTWSSANEQVCTVSATGLVTATGIGSTLVTATTEDGGFIATCTITVENSTGIVEVRDSINDSYPTYDAMGRKVQELKKGQLYIRQGKKFVVK